MQHYKSMEELYEESKENCFKIETPQQAQWAVEKMKEAEKDKAMWLDHYKKQMDMAVNACDRTIESMSLFLEEYFEVLPKKETKTQFSYDGLPGAKLIRKKESQKFTQEKEELLKYFKENHMEEFIKIEESPKWGDFKKQIEVNGNQVIDRETGEVVKGITVEIVPSQFTVQLKGDMNE